ncbi:hypothetical protein D3C77_448000 [compost metagenome]
MHYEAYSGVTAADLNNARVAVLLAETNDSLAEALAGRDFWQEHLRGTYLNRFTALVDAYQVPLADYWVQVEAGEISEQAYLEQSRALMHELNVAERELFLELTREAYERWPIQ